MLWNFHSFAGALAAVGIAGTAVAACSSDGSSSSSGGGGGGAASSEGNGASTQHGSSSGSDGTGAGSGAGGSGSGGAPPNAHFPVTISADKKYLQDADGKPFLMRGDASWSAIVNLSKTDATQYLDDRKSRGFNTLLVSLIEHSFSSQDPHWKNAEGEVPFTDMNDFTTTNEAYFAHVDWFLDAADKRGFLVLLTPSYMGYNCGDEGWCAEMKSNGPTKLGQYGNFVGTRYKDFPNILWVEGGDYTPSTSGNPSELDLVSAIANGIKAGDEGKHLHTAHWSEISAASVSVPWLDVDNTYTYTAPQTYQETLANFDDDDGVRPFFLIEAAYENEHQTTPLQWRAQMYHPVLSGGTGFVYGNFPMWSFWVPGDDAWFLDDGGFPNGWKTALASPGAGDVTVARDFFASIAWEKLKPDTAHAVLTDGYGSGDAFALLASTPDGKLAVTYFTDHELTVTIDLSKMAGKTTARWVDPSSGHSTNDAGSPFPASGTHAFKPPGKTADDSTDWLLVLEAP